MLNITNSQAKTVVAKLETQGGTIRDSNHPKVTMATSMTSLLHSEVLTDSNPNKLKEIQPNSIIATTYSRTTTGNGE